MAVDWAEKLVGLMVRLRVDKWVHKTVDETVDERGSKLADKMELDGVVALADSKVAMLAEEWACSTEL